MCGSCRARQTPAWYSPIIAMVCLLLDVAVRKFKFKWIHEIVRDRRAMKTLGGGGTVRNEGSDKVRAVYPYDRVREEGKGNETTDRI